MKVMTITYNDPGISWGPAVHFLELWNEIARSDPGFEIVGYAPSWTGKAPIIAPRFDLKVVKVPEIRFLQQVIWDLIVAFRIVVERPDLVYIRWSAFHLFTLFVLAFLSTPVAAEMNGSAVADNASSGSSGLRTRLVAANERLLLRRASIVFSVTERLLEHCREIGPQAVHIHVDNGVARNFFEVRPDPAPGIRFIYVGTFTPWDGAKEVVELARQRPDLSFRMVGDGGCRRELERTAPANVEFTGWVEYSRLPGEYALCNAGIVLYEVERHRQTSLSSMKTREYLAAGLPIFSTRVTGQEFIEENGYGLLSHGDIQRDLQTFVERHEDYRRTLAAAAPDLFKRHSWASVGLKTAGCLEEIQRRRPEPNEHRIST